MGRARSTPRSRVPLHRQLRTDAAAVRRWLLVVALAAATATLVAHSVSRGLEEKERWGSTRAVLVTTTPVDARHHLDGAVRVEEWPVALLPDDAVAELPAGARALAPLPRGLPLTEGAIRPDPLTGDEDGGRTRVAVPLGPASMTLREGDVVDLWSTRDPSLTEPAADRTTRTHRVAVAAVVVGEASERSVTVAVRSGEAEDVVEALALATVTVAAVG